MKYLYDAIRRYSIESYEQSLKESSDTTDDGYAALIESAEMQNVVRSPGKDTLETMCEAHSEVINQIQDFEISLLNGSFGPTCRLWASFLQMVQILFDFMCSIKLGNWKLHMQSTEDTYYMVTMQKLPESHAFIHKQFEAGNFSVRRQPGKFNKIPSDQAIEQTINRDQKCPGGIIGFSTSESNNQRWSLTSHVAAKLQYQLEEMLGITDHICMTKDLAQKGFHLTRNALHEAMNC